MTQLRIENRAASPGRRRFWALALAAEAVLLSLLVVFAVAPRAYASEGQGLTCVGFDFQAPQASDLVLPSPGAAYYLVVEFDKNVSYAQPGADASFVQENLDKVHLQKADGTEVAFSWTEGAHDMQDRCLIYVWIDEWLDPLTEYRVVVDAGIVAANGEDVLAEPATFEFKTSSLCANGLSIFENVGMFLVALVVVAGATVQVTRVVRRRK